MASNCAVCFHFYFLLFFFLIALLSHVLWPHSVVALFFLILAFTTFHVMLSHVCTNLVIRAKICTLRFATSVAQLVMLFLTYSATMSLETSLRAIVMNVIHFV